MDISSVQHSSGDLLLDSWIFDRLLLCLVFSAILAAFVKRRIINMTRRLFIAILALCLSSTLASCGGSSGPSKSLKVTMTDFTFSPNTFTVPAGETISLSITNNGAVAHSFIIMNAGYQLRGHFADADPSSIYWQGAPIVTPGQSVNTEFSAPGEPGDYQIVCGVSGHLEAGMVAKLVVVSQP
jgi:uncharacterized cupredoxin-like copper-binding protein